MKHIGYLGPEGTYSGIACEKYIQLKQELGSFRSYPKRSFFDLFDALANNTFDCIIVPIENSVQGPVTLPIDLMIDHDDFRIISEVVIPIKNELIALPSCNPAEIDTILSHEQPLAQCHKTIHSKYPNATLIPVGSTSQAVAQLIESFENQGSKGFNPTKTAVIAHAQLAKQKGLKILVDSMNDYANNQTRFWVISKSENKHTGRDKTSVIFTLEKERSGSLNKVLETFAKNEINLTQISSRPSKKALGEYVFWIDLEGHQSESKIENALQLIKNQSSDFRCLGSYERDPLC